MHAAAGRADPVAPQHADLRQHAAAGRTADASSSRELLGEDAVSSHHGSLSADLRHETEQRLKYGRAEGGRRDGVAGTGHRRRLHRPRRADRFAAVDRHVPAADRPVGALRWDSIPKGRLFALTRDELLECMALMRAVKAGRLDAIPIPEAPLDVLAQQIVAECVGAGMGRRRAVRAVPAGVSVSRPVRGDDFDETLRVPQRRVRLGNSGRGRSICITTTSNRRCGRGRWRGWRRSATAGRFRRPTRTASCSSRRDTVVGSVDEDFAVESSAGDIFLLGNTSWRIQHVRGSDLIVTDAHGAPPTIPFWRGEAPGRTLELSEEVSRPPHRHCRPVGNGAPVAVRGQ